MTLSAQVNVQYSASELGAHTVAEPSFEPRVQLALAYENGVAVNQADLQWTVSRTIAGGASETIDLSAGLLDAFNQPLAFAEIVAVIITTDAENEANLELGGAAAEAWVGIFKAATDVIKIPPGAMFAIATGGDNGLGAVDGTSNSLKFTNMSATVACDFTVAILGRSQ
jgi:hypothetical protein